MKFQKLCYLFCVLFLLSEVKAQQVISISKVEKAIKIDGILDDSWKDMQVYSDFLNSSPIDTGKAQSRTEVRICYDQNFFYLFAKCYESKEGKPIVESLKRDFSYPRTDAFVVFLDPYNDGANGFSFACNTYGAQREGVLESGGNLGVTTSWDNKWYSEVVRTDSVWTVEMAIPFKSLRFNESNLNWKINFSRNDQKLNETSTWVHVPRNFNVANMAFMADLLWEEHPPVSGKNISLIPYLRAGYSEKLEGDVGMDAKIGISSALNLDLTVNPDFSAVEVDQQVTNLDRFELFFPERRQFFIENSDLFSSLGFANSRPFFSRRIGLTNDAKGRVIENPILGGLRLSGKINDQIRIGVMSVQTSNGQDNTLNPENFSIASIQKKVFKRSTIGGFYLDKESFTSNGEYLKKRSVKTTGAEFNFNSWDSKWQGKTFVHSSFDSTNKVGVNQGFNLNYSNKYFNASITQEMVTTDFNAEAGYVRRKNYFYVKPTIEYIVYPKTDKLIFYSFGGGSQDYLDLQGNPNDLSHYVYYKTRLKNTAQMQLTFSNSYLKLNKDFDPSGAGGEKLLLGSEYRMNNIVYQFTSNERKSLFLDIKTGGGEYFNGDKFYLNGSLRYRIVPKFVFSLNYSYDKIILPSPYTSTTWTLVGPKFEYLFTTKLFWTTYIQYNQQLDNVNINSRLQWRYKPASDLFIVYTDNYLPDSFANKSRGIVVKFTYWFNI